MCHVKHCKPDELKWGGFGLAEIANLAQNDRVGADLPEIERQEFLSRLGACSPVPLSKTQAGHLFQHYSELRRWNPKISLLGPVAAEEVVERHYGESLAALTLLPRRPGVLLDLGTGAGFPGLVLAIARPEIEVTLVESRGRKWSFLMSVCRRLALSCNCVNVRVGASPVAGLPRKIDWITTRAVRFEDPGLSVLLQRLAPRGALLLWVGAASPVLPESLRIRSTSPLAGSMNRRLLEIVREEYDRAD